MDETMRVASMDLCTEVLQLPTPQLCKMLRSLHRISPCLCDYLPFRHLNHLAQVWMVIQFHRRLFWFQILYSFFFFFWVFVLFFFKCLILKFSPLNQSRLPPLIFFIWCLILILLYFFFLGILSSIIVFLKFIF